MTPKQERFVQEYLVDLNATQAAIRAGFSARTAKQQGSRLLTNVDVQAAITAKQANVAERNDLTVDFVLGGLKKNYARAMQEEPVYDRDGKPTGEFVYQGAVANRALELLGKHLKVFNEDGGTSVTRIEVVLIREAPIRIALPPPDTVEAVFMVEGESDE